MTIKRQTMKAAKCCRVFALITVFNITIAKDTQADEGVTTMSMSIRSADFVHRGEIPKQFTCQGDDSSPALSWSGVPATAKSLVLIVDDPDAPDPANPKMTWVHWVLRSEEHTSELQSQR